MRSPKPKALEGMRKPSRKQNQACGNNRVGTAGAPGAAGDPAFRSPQDRSRFRCKHAQMASPLRPRRDRLDGHPFCLAHRRIAPPPRGGEESSPRMQARTGRQARKITKHDVRKTDHATEPNNHRSATKGPNRKERMRRRHPAPAGQPRERAVPLDRTRVPSSTWSNIPHVPPPVPAPSHPETRNFPLAALAASTIEG